MQRSIVILTFLLMLSPRSTAAQAFVNPFVGTTLTSPSQAGSATKPGFGIAFGSLGHIVGGETEIAYYPQMIDNAANGIAKNRVFTFSGGVLVGPTIGRIKPYAALGAGDLYLNVTRLSSLVIPDANSIATNYFTFNVGGGVMGFFTEHLGIRGDLRYFRAYGFNVADLQTTGLSLTHFDFWRASIGLAAKF